MLRFVVCLQQKSFIFKFKVQWVLQSPSPYGCVVIGQYSVFYIVLTQPSDRQPSSIANHYTSSCSVVVFTMYIPGVTMTHSYSPES